ncbi:hypothetical protein CAEBREN_03370 [Caenorhabditis brenneri]|uniref:Serpentine receptor class gamma n=1 Tax=Caenorhabditis brenneri TaxID=135651 RepID=G0N129_CAEBE|nr:hypothetical protein CAEBREN_03370 [Caenorhabditis brenneri]
MGRLFSVKTSQPEKYILYQTLFLVVFRLLYIPLILYLYSITPDFNRRWFQLGLIIVDLSVTHFIIQASYLSCNKKHVESMLVICGSIGNAMTAEHPSTGESFAVVE